MSTEKAANMAEPWMWNGRTPYFPDGVHCHHGYPPGEYCPACGEIPDLAATVLDEEHDFGCRCFVCEEDSPHG